MPDTVIESATTTVDNSLVESRHAGMGHKILKRGTSIIATENQEQLRYAARLVMKLKELGITPSRVAHIGGGFCVNPRVMSLASTAVQTVYEIEPALERYATGFTFIPGDWKTTITGMFNVIVYDVDETPAQDERTLIWSHLEPAGVVFWPRGFRVKSGGTSDGQLEP